MSPALIGCEDTAIGLSSMSAAFLIIALLVVLVALVIANTRSVKLSWVVGTTQASLVWIIVVAAVLGWLLGIITSVIFQVRTRRRPSA